MFQHLHPQSTYIERVPQCMSPLGIGTLPPPLSPASVPLPPEPKGGGGTLACGWGVRGVPIPTTGEKLSTLPTLCLHRNSCTIMWLLSQIWSLKGQCHEIFCFWFFSWISFPQASDYTIRAENFERKFAEIFAAQGLPTVSTTPVAICHRRRWHRCRWYRWQICHRCRWHRWCTLTCEYLREFWKKLEMILYVIIRGLGEGDSWKKPEAKNLVTLSL